MSAACPGARPSTRQRGLSFDEATSNIDAESENDIMREIHSLAKTKTVILISHRLANVVNSDRIYVMEKGCRCRNGKPR